MANALDAVLQYRAQEQQKQQVQGEQIAQAFQIFQQARQQAIANQLAQLQMKASLAEKGLVIDPTSPSGFKKDDSLRSDLDKLIERGRGAAAEKSIYDAGGPPPSIFSENKVGGAVGQVIGKASTTSEQPSNIVVKDYDEFGRPKGFVDLNAKTQEKMAEGIPADKTGLYNLSKESIGNIENIKDVLFPNKDAKNFDERAKSFDRGAAFQSNTPNLKLPFNVQVGPDFISTEKGQDVYRWASTAVSAKQLIQTGVAARPDETKKLVQAFIPGAVSSSRSSLKGLNELQNFYVSFNHDLKTLGTDDLQKKYPGVKEYLKSMGNGENKLTNVSLPSEIKTTSQAVEYLMKNNNMSKDEAINWIRSQ